MLSASHQLLPQNTFAIISVYCNELMEYITNNVLQVTMAMGRHEQPGGTVYDQTLNLNGSNAHIL